MAYFTARVEYALHTLFNLARAGSGVAPSARDLADFQKLPVAFVQKLLTLLEKSGLVTGSEGVRGGWRLARHASSITMLEIADAVQGPSPLFECRNIRARCALWRDDAPPAVATEGVCSIHSIMLEAEAAMRRELARHTLTSLETAVASKTSPAGQEALRAWFVQRLTERRSGTTRENQDG